MFEEKLNRSSVPSQSILARNRKAYDAEEVIRSYSARKDLQKPEETILNLFQSRWVTMSFLDLGVGGGRTTEYFAPLVKRYLGLDYSEGMIRACRQRFDPGRPDVQFDVCDARKIEICTEGSFDFVLFSYNGIDYVSHEDRLQILCEVRRVLRQGGHFFFSSHNIRSVTDMFRFPLTRNPARMLRLLRRYCLLRLNNPDYQQRMNCSHGFFNDGAEKFKLQTYYIDPEEQVSQLEQLGFQGIRKFSIRDGSEIGTNSRFLENHGSWLYYLCQAGDRLA